jgi:flavin-binding protein dodecin
MLGPPGVAARLVSFDLRRGAPLDPCGGCPRARECEIITVPDPADRHNPRRKATMSVYRVIDVVGTSTTSWEEAAADAIKTAGQSVRDLRVAEVIKQDIHVGDGGELVYRTKIQLSFKYEHES